ncbi:hypothetical protein ACRALDRAFT_213036 [Sodiomyces alcalophilus JCM 7366]|uniref:uncharacterized protein n=1 Tax=Sodiomyces alcalophilus JCM 7366 TaxID=591952 RepID=UPI0039B4E10D
MLRPNGSLQILFDQTHFRLSTLENAPSPPMMQSTTPNSSQHREDMRQALFIPHIQTTNVYTMFIQYVYVSAHPHLREATPDPSRDKLAPIHIYVHQVYQHIRQDAPSLCPSPGWAVPYFGRGRQKRRDGEQEIPTKRNRPFLLKEDSTPIMTLCSRLSRQEGPAPQLQGKPTRMEEWKKRDSHPLDHGAAAAATLHYRPSQKWGESTVSHASTPHSQHKP